MREHTLLFLDSDLSKQLVNMRIHHNMFNKKLSWKGIANALQTWGMCNKMNFQHVQFAFNR